LGCDLWWDILHKSASDGLELLLVRQVVQETWKILRFERHQTLGIDRRVRQNREAEAISKALQAAHQRDHKAAQKPAQPTTELSRMHAHCDVIEATIEDIDALVKRGEMHQVELMHNRALEDGIDLQEQLDRLISAAIKRRNEALQSLTYYRATLGERLRKLTDAIIDGEAVEVSRKSLIEASISSVAEEKAIPEDTRSKPTAMNTPITSIKPAE
jgi:hypothetical protein